MAEPAVELVGVSRRFDGVPAVDDVSLAIHEGEFFSLLGPSGCGKSTTLRMIGGFERPNEGDVLLRGVRVNELPPNRRPTNMVFQHLGLFPHLSVFENVAFGLRLRRVARAEIARRVAEKLEIVNLQGFGRRYPDELSGGQQQRVAIARALVNEPQVLLLDEPLGALDLRLRQKMQTELKAIQQRLGTTFVYVTHDQSEAFTMSDRIGIMNLGRLEQVATPREIYRRPATEFVADFVGETNLLRAKVTAIEAGIARLEGAGLHLVAAGEGLAQGQEVSLSIRPEHVTLAEGEGGDPVTVRTVTFQGSFVHLMLETAGGTVLMARVVDGARGHDLAPGDLARVSWRPENVRLVA
jgi:spermidine/putrescine transport system ATP-binding protein